MLRKRFLLLGLLLPFAALLWALKSAASWRPVVVGVQANGSYPSFSPDGRLLLVGDANSLAQGHIWDVSQNRPLWKTRDVPLLFTWDSQNLLCARVASPAGEEYRTLDIVRFELRQARTGRLIRAFANRHPSQNGSVRDPLLDVGFSRDGRELRIATALHLQRFDVKSGQVLQDVRWRGLANPRAGLSEASFSFDRQWLVAFERGIVFFDAQSGQKIRRLPSTRRVWSDSILSVSPDNTLFCEMSSAANQARVFRVSNGKEVWRCADWPNFSWDGGRVFVPAAPGVDVLDARTGRKIQHLPGPLEYGFSPSPDGNWLYEARDGKIWRWRAR